MAASAWAIALKSKQSEYVTPPTSTLTLGRVGFAETDGTVFLAIMNLVMDKHRWALTPTPQTQKCLASFRVGDSAGNLQLEGEWNQFVDIEAEVAFRDDGGENVLVAVYGLGCFFGEGQSE